MTPPSDEVREWVLGSIDLQRAVFGPSYGSSETIPVIEKSAYDQLKADCDHLRQLLSEAREALDKMLLAAYWFHEGPSGPSPEIDDYKEAQKTLTKLDAAIKGE